MVVAGITDPLHQGALDCEGGNKEYVLALEMQEMPWGISQYYNDLTLSQ